MSALATALVEPCYQRKLIHRLTYRSLMWFPGTAGFQQISHIPISTAASAIVREGRRRTHLSKSDGLSASTHLAIDLASALP